MRADEYYWKDNLRGVGCGYLSQSYPLKKNETMEEDASSHNDHLRTRIAVLYCVSNAYTGAREKERLADGEIIEVATAIKSALQLSGYISKMVRFNPSNPQELKNFDLIFNLAETIYGFPLADYEVAMQLEELGIPYTGAGSQSLRTCLNKAETKRILQSKGIPTPVFEVVEPHHSPTFSMQYPLIVKPVHEDGCVGVSSNSKVMDRVHLEHQIREIHETYQQAALLEEFIEGRDVTASILGNAENAVVLPLSEIIYTNPEDPTHLTFEANWDPETPAYQGSRSQCPALIDKTLDKRIRTIALKAFKTMDCRDYARVDFRIRGNDIFVLEVNPNPCINPEGAGYVKAARAVGFSYPELISRILDRVKKDSTTMRIRLEEKVLA